MKALKVKVRLPFFSVKHVEAYQVGISYYSYMPSTLVGAIGYALGIAGLCNVDQCKEEAKKLVKKAREYFVSSKVPLAVRFPVILKRLRKVLEQKKLPEVSEANPVYKTLTSASDAMVREYTFSAEKGFIFLGDVEKIRKVVYLIDRIGDSESLISVTSVDEVELTECAERKVNVVTKVGVWSMTGNHVIAPGMDEKLEKALFVFPFYSKDNKAYYSPIEVNEKVLCSKDGEIRVPAGDDW